MNRQIYILTFFLMTYSVVLTGQNRSRQKYFKIHLTLNGVSLFNNTKIDTNELIFPTCLNLAVDTLSISGTSKNYCNDKVGYILIEKNSNNSISFKIESFSLVPDCVRGSEYEFQNDDNCLGEKEIILIKQRCTEKNDYRKLIYIDGLKIIADNGLTVERFRFPTICFKLKD